MAGANHAPLGINGTSEALLWSRHKPLIEGALLAIPTHLTTNMNPPWQRKGCNALCWFHRHLSQWVAARVQIPLAALKTLYWLLDFEGPSCQSGC